MAAVHEVVDWAVLAEGAGLEMTLGLCKKWFVAHFWALEVYLSVKPGVGFSAELAKLGVDMHNE